MRAAIAELCVAADAELEVRNVARALREDRRTSHALGGGVANGSTLTVTQGDYMFATAGFGQPDYASHDRTGRSTSTERSAPFVLGGGGPERHLMTPGGTATRR